MAVAIAAGGGDLFWLVGRAAWYGLLVLFVMGRHGHSAAGHRAEIVYLTIKGSFVPLLCLLYPQNDAGACFSYTCLPAVAYLDSPLTI